MKTEKGMKFIMEIEEIIEKVKKFVKHKKIKDLCEFLDDINEADFPGIF